MLSTPPTNANAARPCPNIPAASNAPTLKFGVEFFRPEQILRRQLRPFREIGFEGCRYAYSAISSREFTGVSTAYSRNLSLKLLQHFDYDLVCRNDCLGQIGDLKLSEVLEEG
jgi:hypothetical protein